MPRFLMRLAWVILPLLAAGSVCAQYSEAEVKAAFIFNLARYVQWPEEVLPPGAPLRLCVPGERADLAEAVQRLNGKQVRQRPLEVVTGDRLAGLLPCHVVVLSHQPAASLRQTAEVRGLLTVGDDEGFTEAGGMIGIMVIDNRVQFEANLEAARNSNIQLPAQLLKLARRVRGS